jgi:hypothetical protein
MEIFALVHVAISIAGSLFRAGRARCDAYQKAFEKGSTFFLATKYD